MKPTIKIFALILLVFGLAAGIGWSAYMGKIYHKQGGAEMVVASGGKITVLSGGTVTLASGSTFANANKGVSITAVSAWADTAGWSGPKLFVFAASDTLFVYTPAHTVKKFPAI